MAEGRGIVIPREVVNDDIVKVVAWHVAPGAAVKKGQVVAEFETSKATIEIAAEGDGYVEVLVGAGGEVAVGGEIGRLSPAPPVGAAPGTGGAESAGDSRVSLRARKLIAELGLDPEVFRDHAVVREADVRREWERLRAQPGSSGASAPARAPETPRGAFHDARSAARDRGRGGLWLALNYVFRNYALGLAVRVAPRGIILSLHRLRGVTIGRGCFIDPTAIVETAYPENVVVGNDVRIAPGAIIMTHVKAPHYLREIGAVPLLLRKVVLEDHCFIGVSAVILPGVTVGRASVVASGAVVSTNVPAFSMVAGNPARVVKRFALPASGKGTSG